MSGDRTHPKVAVVTVHGTGDTAESPDGTKWFQRGSAFTDKLKQGLQQQGLDADIIPHLWSGANSAWERERGADKLARRIHNLFDRYESIHVIGHSHGGNVANDAAVLLKWGLKKTAKNERFDSLITVGTPFFNTRSSWLQVLAGVLFLIIAWGSAIAFPFMAGYFIYLAWIATPSAGAQIGALLYIFGVGACVLFMFNMSRAGVRRLLRPRFKNGRGKAKTPVFALWHENDEAISFLQRVEELPLEAFPRGSLFRGARGAAIGIGVLLTIVFNLALPGLYALDHIFHVGDFLGLGVGPGELASNIVAAQVIGLIAAPALFTLFYFLYRWFVGGTTEIAARGSMNRYIVGVVRGIAMGRDGDQVLCNVSTVSHTHPTETHLLSGDIAQRMQTRAHDAAGKLIDKYRWSLFSVGGDSSASLTSLTTDAMTWDSLIHTTYFDQPEVGQVIAAYIAAKAKNEAYTPAPAQAAAPAPAPVEVAPPPPPPPAAPETPDGAPQPA